jgi:hypothetical protein
VRITLALLALVLPVVVSCTTVVQPPGRPLPAEDPSIGADREVCRDLDAKGGGFYTTVVVPMLGPGPSGRKSIDVDIVAMENAVGSLVDVGGTARARASQAVQDEAEQTARSAGAFDLYAHAEVTSLLTAFTGLAVECTKAGHQPTWFDPESLTG